MTTPQSGAALLARVQPRLRVEHARICLRPDLLHAHEEAEAELAESKVREGGGGRLSSGGTTATTRKLAKRVQEIEAELEATEIRVTFQAMSKDDWTALTEQYPPGKDDEIDKIIGYNRDAAYDAAVRKCMIDPVFEDCNERGCEHIDCGTWQQFIAVCNPSEWAVLRSAVELVNRGVTELPKSSLARTVLNTRVAASKSPKSGASARESSTGGRRASSTST